MKTGKTLTIFAVILVTGIVSRSARGQGEWEDHRPVISPDGRTLAFMSNRSGPWAVYLMPLDASRPPRRVSDDPRGEWYPDWAPDGRTLVYHRSDSEHGVSFLRTFRLDTGRENALGATDGNRQFARWNPDGKTVYYMCGDIGVCAMSTDGKEQGVAFGLDGNQGDPVISPDGRWIAYVDPLPGDSNDIFVRGIDGSERIRVTRDPGRSYGLDWSPDGRLLAYNTTVDENSDVYVYDVATRRSRRLTTDPSVDHMPRWYPDGRALVFTSERSGHERVYRVAPDGSELRSIDTSGPKQQDGAASRTLSRELHPSWDPTGTRLVFDSDRAGSTDIYVMELQTGQTTKLTLGPSQDERPVWSPDGAWIAFHSNRSGNFDLYMVRPDGSDLTRLTMSALDETNAGWDPASRRLVFEISQDNHWTLGIIDIRDRIIRRILDEPGDHLTPAWIAADRLAYTYSPPGGNHDTDIVIRTADATGKDLGELLGGARGNSNVHYSAARNRIAFNSIRDGNWEIYTAGLSGEDERRLTTQGRPDLQGIDGQPWWNPAGTEIAITSGRAGSLDIVLIDTSGNEIRNLTASWTCDHQ